MNRIKKFRASPAQPISMTDIGQHIRHVELLNDVLARKVVLSDEEKKRQLALIEERDSLLGFAAYIKPETMSDAIAALGAAALIAEDLVAHQLSEEQANDMLGDLRRFIAGALSVVSEEAGLEITGLCEEWVAQEPAKYWPSSSDESAPTVQLKANHIRAAGGHQ